MTNLSAYLEGLELSISSPEGSSPSMRSILAEKRDSMWVKALEKRGAKYLKKLADERPAGPLVRGVPIPTRNSILGTLPCSGSEKI